MSPCAVRLESWADKPLADPSKTATNQKQKGNKMEFALTTNGKTAEEIVNALEASADFFHSMDIDEEVFYWNTKFLHALELIERALGLPEDSLTATAHDEWYGADCDHTKRPDAR
jgi:hypothetical protein